MEALIEGGRIMGGINVKQIKAFMEEVQAGKGILEKGLLLLDLWAEGRYVLPAIEKREVKVLGLDKELAKIGLNDALETLDEIGVLPPGVFERIPAEALDHLKIVGDLVKIRNAVKDRRLTVEDAREYLKTMHSAYSAVESAHTDFLSRIEEFGVSEGMRVSAKHYEARVYERLRLLLEQVRPRVTRLMEI